jgi:hypothetical protein
MPRLADLIMLERRTGFDAIHIFSLATSVGKARKAADRNDIFGL